MQKLTVTVDSDGRVKIPGTSVGQTITIHLEPELESDQRAVVSTPEEQRQLIAELLEEGRRFREQADPEWLKRNHDEWLYGPDGLPR